MKIEVGGGIRNLDSVKTYLEGGIDRVILGSAAVNDRKLLEKCVMLYGDRIIVGIDARNGKVSVSGWTSDSDIDYISTVFALASLSAHLKNIAQAMIDERFPEPIEDEEEDEGDAKKERKEEKKAEKKAKKEEKKAEKKAQDEQKDE